ncbi:MAG: SnoaL-like domain-containing protein [Kofleriaceae bacterium]|nr:SnoaL-like domain-containing protein [Kofleriaceae bacterium]
MPLSPREVALQVIDGIVHKKWGELARFYAEHTVVQHPFAMPSPSRLDGRDALRAHFEHAAALPIELEARNIVVHETADPEVIVVEYEYHGKVTTTGRAFVVGNIFVWRVRDGQIVEARDYANHRAFAEALG